MLHVVLRQRFGEKYLLSHRLVILADEVTKLLDACLKALRRICSITEVAFYFSQVGSYLSAFVRANYDVMFSGFNDTIQDLGIASGRECTWFILPTIRADQCTFNKFENEIITAMKGKVKMLPSAVLSACGWSAGLMGAIVQ